MDIKVDGKKGFNIETKMNCETLNTPKESIATQKLKQQRFRVIKK